MLRLAPLGSERERRWVAAVMERIRDDHRRVPAMTRADLLRLCDDQVPGSGLEELLHAAGVCKGRASGRVRQRWGSKSIPDIATSP